VEVNLKSYFNSTSPIKSYTEHIEDKDTEARLKFLGEYRSYATMPLRGFNKSLYPTQQDLYAVECLHVLRNRGKI